MKKESIIYPLFLLIGLAAVSGCSKSAEIVPAMTIDQIIASDEFRESTSVPDNKALDTLVKYIKLFPDLLSLLNGNEKYTLFAPTNKAFKDMSNMPGFPSSSIKALDTAILKKILKYHVTKGQKLKLDVIREFPLNSILVDPAKVPVPILANFDETVVIDPLPNVRIILADQKGRNGVLHVIDAVLVPKL